MATIRKRSNRWHAQVRRQGHQATKSFLSRKDAETWVAKDLITFLIHLEKEEVGDLLHIVAV